MALINCKIC